MNILIFSKPFFTAFIMATACTFSVLEPSVVAMGHRRARARLTCFQTERTPGPEQGEGIEPKLLARAICSDSSMIPLLGAQSERSPAGGAGPFFSKSIWQNFAKCSQHFDFCFAKFGLFSAPSAPHSASKY